jgi:SIR2-like domain
MPFVDLTSVHELVEAYRTTPSKFVFFVGAGLSRPTFPSWQNFLKEMLDSLSESEMAAQDREELLKHIQGYKNYLAVAQIISERLGSNRLRDIFERVFDIEFAFTEIPDAYKALFEIDSTTILTTNYDRIPNVLAGSSYRFFTNKQSAEALRSFSDGKRLFYKAHGDILDNSSIVLTENQFDSTILTDNQAQEFLKTVFSTKSVIFLGFGLADPDFELILKKIRFIYNGIQHTHFALLSNPDFLDKTRLNQSYGVKVINYTPSNRDHPEVKEFLNLLKGEKVQEPDLSIEDAILKIQEVLKVQLDYRNIIITRKKTSDEKVHVGISLAQYAETKIELQREVLILSRKLLLISCKNIEEVSVLFHRLTDSSEEFFSHNQASIFFKLNRKSVLEMGTDRELWGQISFFSVHKNLSEFGLVPIQIDFPYRESQL